MKNGGGFTIVELLVVITVIGILAAITTIAYSGISQKAVYSSMQSDLSNAYKQLELSRVENGYYPLTINCGIPDGPDNKCINFSANSASHPYMTPIGDTKPQKFVIQATNGSQSVVVDQKGNVVDGSTNVNLLSGDTSIEKTSSSEFVQYYDLAPIFDKYGYGVGNKYTISFDIKSADITNKNSVVVYMQNGSGSRYGFSVSVPVTISYARKSVTVTPALTNAVLTKSMLAFYGIYGTGNKVTVKNVKVEFGSAATDWSQAPF